MTAALVVVADQLTKQAASSAWGSTPLQGPHLLDGWLVFTYSTNSGGAFGVLQGNGPLFLAVGVLILVGLTLMVRALTPQQHALALPSALVAGGATGNLLDRVRLGYVVDFIQVQLWPVFNIADSALVCGVILLAFRLALPPASQSGAAAPQPCNDLAGKEAHGRRIREPGKSERGG
jgi:signal peptidase II